MKTRHHQPNIRMYPKNHCYNFKLQLCIIMRYFILASFVNFSTALIDLKEVWPILLHTELFLNLQVVSNYNSLLDWSCTQAPSLLPWYSNLASYNQAAVWWHRADCDIVTCVRWRVMSVLWLKLRDFSLHWKSSSVWEKLIRRRRWQEFTQQTSSHPPCTSTIIFWTTQ